MAPTTAQVQAEWDAALRTYVGRRLHDVHAVDDVVQDVYMRVHTGLPHLRNEDRLAPWLFRIARSAVTDHVRARRPDRSLTEDPATASPVDEAQEVRAFLGSCLGAFLEELTSADQDVLLAVDAGGQPQAAYAREHDLAPSAARSRTQRARSRLRARLEACCRIAVDARGAPVEFERRAPCDDCA